MNGIEVAGRMIDAGLVDYALLVDGESAPRRRGVHDQAPFAPG